MDGSYTLTAIASDQVGNAGQTSIAVTVDKAGAIVKIQLQPNGQVLLRFAGAPGHTYRIEASSDLEHWTTIGSVTAPLSGILEFSDLEAAQYWQRFYRTAEP